MLVGFKFQLVNWIFLLELFIPSVFVFCNGFGILNGGDLSSIMILGSSFTQETHYGILSVKEDASYDEIWVSYRSAILNSHPDKQLSENESGDNFLKVQKAWEILSNPKSRAVYDSDLRASREDSVAAEDVSLEEMMAEDGVVSLGTILLMSLWWLFLCWFLRVG